MYLCEIVKFLNIINIGKIKYFWILIAGNCNLASLKNDIHEPTGEFLDNMRLYLHRRRPNDIV